MAADEAESSVETTLDICGQTSTAHVSLDTSIGYTPVSNGTSIIDQLLYGQPSPEDCLYGQPSPEDCLGLQIEHILTRFH
jgi:hypothetical protein